MFKLLILVFLFFGLINCSNNKMTNTYNNTIYDVPKYIINDYSSSLFIRELVDKMRNVSWYIETDTSKEELIYFLNEAIKIFNNKLCLSNPYSSIVVKDLKNDYKLLTRVESVVQKSGIVFFYVFENTELNDEIHVAIRKIKNSNNEYSILCAIPIP